MGNLILCKRCGKEGGTMVRALGGYVHFSCSFPVENRRTRRLNHQLVTRNRRRTARRFARNESR